MSIPSRAEAAQILRAMDPPSWLAGHSAAVADVAAFLAAAIDSRGHAISVGLVEAAALLHDIDKAFPDDHPLKSLGHGYAGAAWAREQGHDELAGAIANHPVMRLADDEHYSTWIRDAIVEERVVAYADKRARQDLVSLDERFAYWVGRHGETPEIKKARERAEALEQDVCAAADISPADVQRLRWATAALGAAGA
jgi:putative nucleotidyltransferase with HDIG domain